MLYVTCEDGKGKKSMCVRALVISGICVLAGRLFASTKFSQGRLYKRAEDRAARGSTEMKSKSQTVLGGGAKQRSKRMTHILLVEKKTKKNFNEKTFHYALGGHSRLNPVTNPHKVTHQARLRKHQRGYSQLRTESARGSRSRDASR